MSRTEKKYMEAVTLTAGAIATLIFSKAVEKGGEKLGEGVAEKIGQLVKVIRQKFQKEGVYGKLIKAEEEPSDKNKSRFKGELVEQMEDDEEFAARITQLMEELKSEPKVNQILLKNLKVKGSAEIEEIEQEARGEGSVSQEAVVDVEVGGDLKIGKAKQRG